MDEATAWLYQAQADRQAAEQFAAAEEESSRCHAIAKWQQTVEKAVKALVCALYEAGVLKITFRPRHEVERYVHALVRLPRTAGNRTIQQRLHGLLDQTTREGIKALDLLVPQMPPTRNTEYPFPDGKGRWTYPAAKDVFSLEEMRQFRALSHRVIDGAWRIVSAIRRGPR